MLFKSFFKRSTKNVNVITNYVAQILSDHTMKYLEYDM